MAYGAESRLPDQATQLERMPVSGTARKELQQAVPEAAESPVLDVNAVSRALYGRCWNELTLHQQFGMTLLDSNGDHLLTFPEVTEAIASAAGVTTLSQQNTDAAVSVFKDKANRQFIALAAAYANLDQREQQQLQQRLDQNEVTGLAEAGVFASVDLGNFNTQDQAINARKRENVAKNLSEFFAQSVDALPMAVQELAVTGQMPNLDASRQVQDSYAIQTQDVGNGETQVAYQLGEAQLLRTQQGIERSAYKPTGNVEQQTFKNPDSYSNELPAEDQLHYEKMNQSLQSPEGKAALEAYSENILSIIDSGDVTQFQEALKPIVKIVAASYKMPELAYSTDFASSTRDENAAYDVGAKKVFVYLEPLQELRQKWTAQGIPEEEQSKRFAAKNLGSITHEFGHGWQNVAFLANPEQFGNKSTDGVVQDYKENLEAYNNAGATRALLGKSDYFSWYASQPLEKHVIAWQKNAENKALEVLGSNIQSLES